MKAALALLAFAAAAIGHPCYWDRDTLVMEAKGLPEVLQAIVGRFDRNPLLYYSMRLDRVSKQIAKDPRNLGLYDDAGVAASRLRRQDEAIQWMERKRKELAAAHASTADLYRTESNEGTFELIKWLSDSQRDEHKNLLNKAIHTIHAALDINPHAHFDRERYQLAYMNWLKDRSKPLSEQMPFPGPDHWSENERVSQTKALVGLIVLGPAWENPDIVGELGRTVAYPHRMATSLSYMGILRRNELRSKGVSSLAKAYEGDTTLIDEDKPYVQKEFTESRREANAFENKRSIFMTDRLAKGLHPDTDPTFWAGWQESDPPKIEPMGWWNRNMEVGNAGPFLWPMIFFFAEAFAVVGVLGFFLARCRKHWRQRYRSTPP